MGSVRGKIVGPDAAGARLARADGTSGSIDTVTSRAGGFEFPDVAPGWYILSSFAPDFRERVEAIRVRAQSPTDVGAMQLQEMRVTERPAPVLTVCEALNHMTRYTHAPAVIVGIFKSGMDDTLRLDCPFQPVTGPQVGWPSSIGLTGPAIPPDSLRDEVEEKRAEVLKSGPPGAHPRPERVVGLYGIFVAPSGLSAAQCCLAMVESILPPARLFGVTERDLRVIR
jgi:hypothetical protein